MVHILYLQGEEASLPNMRLPGSRAERPRPPRNRRSGRARNNGNGEDHQDGQGVGPPGHVGKVPDADGAMDAAPRPRAAVVEPPVHRHKPRAGEGQAPSALVGQQRGAGEGQASRALEGQQRGAGEGQASRALEGQQRGVMPQGVGPAPAEGRPQGLGVPSDQRRARPRGGRAHNKGRLQRPPGLEVMAPVPAAGMPVDSRPNANCVTPSL